MRHLHDLVARELRATIGLLKSAAYSDELCRRLLIAVGELCQLAGWVASDADLSSTAQRYYLAAMRAADGAGDRPLAAQAISSLAYLTANSDDPRTAVVLARSAYEGARGTATATTQALLLERVAWAHARAGELTQTQRRSMRSTARSRSADLRRTRRGCTGSLYTSWLAESHLQPGEIDRAGAAAFRVIELGDRVNSARSDERVAYLRRALGPHRDVASVRAFDERYRSGRGLSD